MKALEAPSSDSTVQELEAFPPLCHRWDKHLQTASGQHCAGQIKRDRVENGYRGVMQNE